MSRPPRTQTPFPPVPEGAIWVFGSNDRGRHGKGTALTARRLYGAIYGQSEGFQGRSYAIPTRCFDPDTEQLRSLPLEKIAANVARFIEAANRHRDKIFYVTAIGTGLAGYNHEQIAPMFADAPHNCLLPEAWREILAGTWHESE